MNRITYYVQKRVDGGRRFGLQVEDATIFGRFVPGNAERDPGLLWYVDVRCRGETLPSAPDEVREWFVRHAGIISDELNELAERLEVGRDVDVWPLRQKIEKSPPGIEMEVVSSAMIRTAPDELAREISGIAKDIRKEVADLPPLARAS